MGSGLVWRFSRLYLRNAAIAPPSYTGLEHMKISADKNKELGIALGRAMAILSSPLFVFKIIQNKLRGSPFNNLEKSILNEIIERLPNEASESLREQIHEINYVSRSIFSKSAEICCYRIIPFFGPIRRRRRALFPEFGAVVFGEISFKVQNKSVSAKLGALEGAFFDISIRGNIGFALDEVEISVVQVDLTLKSYDPWARTV